MHPLLALVVCAGFAAPEGGVATDLRELDGGFVVAVDRWSPDGWSSQLVQFGPEGGQLASHALWGAFLPRFAGSGRGWAMAYADPAHGVVAQLRLFGPELEPTPLEVQLGGHNTSPGAVAWNPKRREWAVTVAEHRASDVRLTLRRYSEKLELLGEDEIACVPHPDFSPSGAFQLWPVGDGYRGLVHPTLALFDWRPGAGVTLRPSLARPPPSIAAVRLDGEAVLIAHIQGDRFTGTQLFLDRVVQDEVVTHTLVATSERGHSFTGSALYPAGKGWEVLWNDRLEGTGGEATYRAVVTRGVAGQAVQVLGFELRHWALRSGHLGPSP